MRPSERSYRTCRTSFPRSLRHRHRARSRPHSFRGGHSPWFRTHSKSHLGTCQLSSPMRACMTHRPPFCCTCRQSSRLHRCTETRCRWLCWRMVVSGSLFDFTVSLCRSLYTFSISFSLSPTPCSLTRSVPLVLSHPIHHSPSHPSLSQPPRPTRSVPVTRARGKAVLALRARSEAKVVWRTV